MKTLLTLLILSIPSVCFADVYVVYNANNVYSISEGDDAVVPVGYSKKILKGSIQDLALQRPIDEYKFNGTKFIVNVDVVKQKEQAQIEAQKKSDNEKAANASGKSKLKTLGLSDEEIAALVGQ